MTRELSASVPFEHFIQALQSQLDRAQTAMALKARAGLPLTFAVRDLSLDLRAHVDFDGAVVKLRPASPGDSAASTVHLALTTITRPMIEENTIQFAVDGDDASLQEAAGDELSAEDIRKLEWAGVQTVSQLVRLREEAGEHALERIAAVPAMRLRAALTRAEGPQIRDVLPVTPPNGSPDDGGSTISVRGRNLMGDAAPIVRLDGSPVNVLRARRNELLLEAPARIMGGGELEIETRPGVRTSATLGALSRGGGA
ncbi:MAG: IPT/TIG domain-containing protein [Gemmatimonadaceae bacterium]